MVHLVYIGESDGHPAPGSMPVGMGPDHKAAIGDAIKRGIAMRIAGSHDTLISRAVKLEPEAVQEIEKALVELAGVSDFAVVSESRKVNAWLKRQRDSSRRSDFPNADEIAAHIRKRNPDATDAFVDAVFELTD